MTMPAFDTNSVPMYGTNPPVASTNVYVPPVPEPIVVPAATGTEYTIVKGDYFEKIAKDHGVTTKAIQDANPGVDSKKLQIGQKIHIPAATATVATPAATQTWWARKMPRKAQFNSAPDSSAETTEGDSLCASGSQVCIGAKPILVP